MWALLRAGLSIEPSNTPELHLHAGRPDGLFERFLAHYEAIWQRSGPFTDTINTIEDNAHNSLLEGRAPIDQDSYRYAIRQAKDMLRHQIGRAYAEYTVQFDDLNRRLNARSAETVPQVGVITSSRLRSWLSR